MQLHSIVIESDDGCKCSESEDRRDEREDDAGGEAGEEVAEVAAGGPVLKPLVVVVQRAFLPHSPLFDCISPVRDSQQDRNQGVLVLSLGLVGRRVWGMGAVCSEGGKSCAGLEAERRQLWEKYSGVELERRGGKIERGW